MMLIKVLTLTVFFLSTYTSAPQSCFYTQLVLFFSGQPPSSPQRYNGYDFDFNWQVPQISITSASFTYVVATSQYPVYFAYRASITKITHSMGSINFNPANGSDVLSITFSIILLKSSEGIAQLIYRELKNIALNSTYTADTVNLSTYFSGKIANYKTQVFLSAFDGYSYNSSNLNYYILLSLSPIIPNTNQQTITNNNPSFQILHSIDQPLQFYLAFYKQSDRGNNLGSYTSHSSWMNYLSYTYILIDLTSFLYTPITQYHEGTWLPTIINVDLNFSPWHQNKCIFGAKKYQLKIAYAQYFILQAQNSTNYSQIYTFTRHNSMDLSPAMVCIGYCKEGYGPLNNICVKCPFFSVTCANMSFSITCIDGYFPQFIGQGYQKCIYCMPSCKTCSNYSACAQCQPTNILTPAKTCQQCDNNTIYSGGICSSVVGCTTAIVVGNRSICKLCDFQGYFEKLPYNSKCVCRSGYILTDGKCKAKCGDGLKLLDKCDDGNTMNFDGCSSLCQIEKGYVCSQKYNGSATECKYVDKINLQYLSISRVKLQNKVYLVFRVNPPMLNDFSSDQITAHQTSNLSLSIGSMSIDGGLLTVQINFQQEIKGQSLQLFLSFNHSSILHQNTSVKVAFSYDQYLTYLNKVLLANIFKHVFIGICLSSLLVLFGSFFVHKMIGLETLMPFQIIYLTYLLIKDETQIFSIFSYFSGTTLDFLFYQNDSIFIQSSQSKSTFNSQNQLFIILIIYTFTFCFALMLAIRFILISTLSKKSLHYAKYHTFFKYCYNRLCLPLSSIFFLPYIIVSSIRCIDKSQNKLYYPSPFQTIALSVVIFSQWSNICQIKSTIIEIINKNCYYISYFLCIQFTISILITTAFVQEFSNILEWLLSIFLISLISAISARPYRNALNNAGLIVGILQVLYFLIWSLLRKNDASYRTQENQILGMFINVGLALSTIVIGALRVVFQISKKCGEKKQNQKTDNLVNEQNMESIKLNFEYKINQEVRYQTKCSFQRYLKSDQKDLCLPISSKYFQKEQMNNQSELKNYLMRKLDRQSSKKNIAKNKLTI